MPPQPWKTISSRIVYQNPWTTVREDIAEMPNGQRTVYGVIEAGHCVGVLIGWVIWLMEAFIAVSLILGIFSRLGGLVGFIQAVNLYIGLAGIPSEWYWSYGMLYTLHLIFFFVPPGRTLGMDAWLRRRLQPSDRDGNRQTGLILLLT